MWEILEIHHELMEAQEEKGDEIRARTAKVKAMEKDIDTLWKQGTSPDHISAILMVHPNIVKARVAALERDEEERREFLQLGIMSESLRTGGYLAITQR